MTVLRSSLPIRLTILGFILGLGLGAPAGAQQIVGGCTVLPANNIWNTPVDGLPVLGNSSALVDTIGATRGFHADFGSGLWDGGPIGTPFITVTAAQPAYPASFLWPGESDAGPYAIPLDAPIQGGPNATGDRHAIAVDVERCVLYELSRAFPQAGSWVADAGAIFNLNSNALRPSMWTSTDAAGLPFMPGLVTYDEVLTGEIRHAIRFTAPQTRREFVWPARHYASSLTGSQYPRMGERFRLKASFDITPYPPDVQVILRAMKKYGIMLADNGTAWYLSGKPDSRWNNDQLHRLHEVLGSNLEAVDATGLMIDPNSGQARQPSNPQLVMDSPARGAVVSPFTVRGWAIDRGATAGTGIDQVHVYAYPSGGGGPIPIGAATYGAARTDVGAIFGAQFNNSGWSIRATGLPNGQYTIVAYGHSTVTGSFNVQTSVDVTVGPVPNPAMSLDQPLSNGSSGTNVTVSGWAIDRGAAGGTGVDQVHVYAFPAAGSPIGVIASYGLARPDVGAVYGAQFTNSGFRVVMPSLPAGTYTFIAYEHSTVSGTFNRTASATNVTVNATSSNPGMSIDTRPGTYTRPFTISGWAVDAGAPGGTGVDAIHVWAFPVGGGPQFFVGWTTSFTPRPDVGAYIGNSRFNNSGYSIPVNAQNVVTPGTYDFHVFAHSTVTNAFSIARVVRMTVN